MRTTLEYVYRTPYVYVCRLHHVCCLHINRSFHPATPHPCWGWWHILHKDLRAAHSSSPIPGVGLGGLMSRTESKALSGLPFTSPDFCDFRAHGPRMRFDDLPTSSGSFAARVSTSAATVDSSPGRGWASRAAANDFASVFAVPTAVSEGSAESRAATTSVVQPTPSRSSVQGTDSVEPAVPTAPVSNSPGSPAPQTMTQSPDRISTRTRRRSATASGKASPAVDYSFRLGGAPRPSSRRVTTPPRVRRPRLAPPAAATPPLADSPVRTVPLTSVRTRPRRGYGNSSLTAHAFSW